MMIQRTLTLVLGDGGQLQIICGGEVTPGEGVNACRAAADWFSAQGVEAEVRRRVEEMRRNGGGEMNMDTQDRQDEGLETPVVDG